MPSKASPEQYLISTQTAALLTGKSVRTLQRWADEGHIRGLEKDGERRGAGGVKLLIELPSLIPHLSLALDAERMATIVAADTGAADALREVGLYFLAEDQAATALLWLEAAAAKGDSDAMDWLSRCYFQGVGVESNVALGLKWLGEAAARGHTLALQKIQAL
ncbi:MAG: hypothetical protein ACP5GA_10565 [Acidithiobacillus sp.]